jgi:gliding motility-associated-like protein
VEAKDIYDCKSYDEIRVEAVPFQIFVPDAFSPNGDEINDALKVQLTYEMDIEFEMKIYNRFGEKVFESLNPYDGWDGWYNHHPCPVEAYFWYLKAEINENSPFFQGTAFQKGSVVLLR